MCGPPIGGFIVTYLNWRWNFYINIPIGILGFALVTVFVEDVREPPRGAFDARGLVLSSITLMASCSVSKHWAGISSALDQ